MSSDRQSAARRGARTSLFPDTRWSLVLQAQGEPDAGARRALGELCQAYWYPLYAFARSRGLSPHDAEDSTQAFFERLLALDSLNDLSADRGRLRGFFLAAMKNFLANQWRAERTQKRGGGARHISIDKDWAEETLGGAGGADAEALYDRHWVVALLNTVSRRLEEHYGHNGRRDLYEAIKGCLEGDGSYQPGAEIAARLGMSPEGVRSAVFKLRRRFREYVEEEVGQTCADAGEAREEIAHLCKILAR